MIRFHRRKPTIERLEGRELLALTVGNFLATQGVPLSNPVAFFRAGDVQGSQPGDFSASIDFGDGTSALGQVQAVSPGRFEILSPHVYSTSSVLPYPIVVRLFGLMNTSKIAAGTALVAPPGISQTITATGLNVSAVVNATSTFEVAAFTDSTATTASDFSAQIDWGDGNSSSGAISSDSNGGYFVLGTHSYSAAGTFTVNVVITRTTTQEVAYVTSTANAANFSLLTIPIAATVGQPLSGPVATFNPASPVTGGQAVISWGDGNTSVGTVAPAPSGGYTVSPASPYAYSIPGSYTVSVTVTDPAGDSATGTTTAQVVNQGPSLVFSGGLAPTVNYRPKGLTAITKNNQPTFAGSAAPFAIVQLYARQAPTSNSFFLGQAIASASGTWSLQVGPLARGAYLISAIVAPPSGSPFPLTPLPGPGGALIIGPTHGSHSRRPEVKLIESRVHAKSVSTHRSTVGHGPKHRPGSSAIPIGQA